MAPIREGVIATHTHGGSAAVRNAAALQIDHFCALTGVTPFYIQTSASDVKNKRDGCRVHYWDKDLAVPQKISFTEDVPLAICDTDYYMDMPVILQNTDQPIIISTFTPTKAACAVGEYTFKFDDLGFVTYNVSGGAIYKHQLWDYNTDILRAAWRDAFGLRYNIRAFHVNKFVLDAHHSIVLLTPFSTYRAWLFYISVLVAGMDLKRFDPVVDGFIQMHIHNKSGAHLSLAKVDTYSEVTIARPMQEALKSITKHGKVGINQAQIKLTTGLVDPTQVALLLDYYSTTIKESKCYVFPIEQAVNNYQYVTDTHMPDMDAKPSLTAFMSPIVNECYAPMKSLANDEVMVSGRVTKIQHKEVLRPTPFLIRCMHEYVQLRVPEPHKLVPWDQEMINSKLDSNSKRHLFNVALDTVADIVDEPSKSFMKAEAYQEVKEPRVITTLPPVNKLTYSSYIYAYTDFSQPAWYAFGKTPVQVAERVSLVCQRAKKRMVMTDLHRFDGKVSSILRDLESMLLLRAFRKEYHEHIMAIQEKQKFRPSVTTFGVWYNSMWTRSSGSHETAIFNSDDNAFMAFMALRSTINPTTGTHYSSQEAWDNLGFYGGDDGGTPDVDLAAYVKVCNQVGQQLDIEEIKPDAFGVNFLSRYYTPLVWKGGLDSMCDLRRMITKFHATHNLPANVTPVVKLVEKSRSLFVTDANTPMLGQFTSLVVRLAAGMEQTDNGIATFWSRESDNYPNNNQNNWMEAYMLRKMEDVDVKRFATWCDTLQTLQQALSPPLCVMLTTPTSTKPVIVNGNLMLAPAVQYVVTESYESPSSPHPANYIGVKKWKTCADDANFVYTNGTKNTQYYVHIAGNFATVNANDVHIHHDDYNSLYKYHCVGKVEKFHCEGRPIKPLTVAVPVDNNTNVIKWSQSKVKQDGNGTNSAAKYHGSKPAKSGKGGWVRPNGRSQPNQQ